MALFFPDFYLNFYFSRPVRTFLCFLDFYFISDLGVFDAAMALLLNSPYEHIRTSVQQYTVRTRTYERTTVHSTNAMCRFPIAAVITVPL